MINITRKQIHFFMALCLLLFVNFQLICQENSIVLGGKNGWTDFIQNSKNITLGKGRYGQQAIQLNTSSHKISDDYNKWTKTKSFDEALTLFETGWYEDFDKFLVQKKQIDKYFPYVAKKKTYRNYICGSVPNVVHAINNLPCC